MSGASGAMAAVVETAGYSGQIAYTTPGTYSWTAPPGIKTVCVVAIGGASSGKDGGPTYNGLYSNGGGGGGLGWKNDIAVTPGQSYTVVVGAGGFLGSVYQAQPGYYAGYPGNDSYFISTSTVLGGGAPAALNGLNWSPGGTYVGDGGGNGGRGGYETVNFVSAGGGGAGGYTGTGGDGALTNAGSAQSGSGGGGGGGGNPNGGGGGGTGLLGQGSNGIGAAYGGVGGGGSGGSNGSGNSGGAYGGGGGGQTGSGGNGAVRIIWGPGRAFPSTNTADV